MPKEIVASYSDSNVYLISLFRQANKRCGEAKRENDTKKWDENLKVLHELAIEAKEKGFQIWVSPITGKTGHTYPKDYKETPDSDNDPNFSILVKTN